MGGRGVLPGLIYAHTHLVWAGDRLDEYRLRSKGAAYEEILEAGGGIHNTVSATVAAGEEELLELALERARVFLAGGVTTLEIKSGYGGEPEAELKMLRVIRSLQERVPQRLVPTLLAHVIPQGWERAEYLRVFTQELIPIVAREGLATAVDVFCDVGAFTLPETERIFEAAVSHGLAVKAHAEQLSHTGATELVARFRGLSADHLEEATPQDWQALARAGSVGMSLPGAAVLLRQRCPDARARWAAGAAGLGRHGPPRCDRAAAQAVPRRAGDVGRRREGSGRDRSQPRLKPLLQPVPGPAAGYRHGRAKRRGGPAGGHSQRGRRPGRTGAGATAGGQSR